MKRKGPDGKDAILIVSGRHRPIELSVLIATLSISFVQLIVQNDSSNYTIIRKILPDFYWVWNIGLILGAAIALVGCFWYELTRSLLFERIGLILVGTLFLSYGVGVLTAIHIYSFSGFYFLFLGVGFCVRAAQISSELKQISSALKKPTLDLTVITSEPITDPSIPRIIDSGESDERK